MPESKKKLGTCQYCEAKPAVRRAETKAHGVLELCEKDYQFLLKGKYLKTREG